MGIPVLRPSLTLALSLVAGLAWAGPLTITTDPDPVPGGEVGEPYQLSLFSTDGRSPYLWSVTSGAIPPGLSLSSSAGVFSGTPTTPGHYDLTVEVHDGDGADGSIELKIAVAESGPQGLHITVPDHVRVEFDEPITYPLTADGGTPPYQWRIRGDLPPGLVLDGDTVRGTATASTASRIILTVTDRAEDADTKTVDFDATKVRRRPVGSSSNRNSSTRGNSGCVCVRTDATPGALGWFAVLGLLVSGTRARRR